VFDVRKILIISAFLMIGLMILGEEASSLTLELPVVITSAGQSAEVETVNYVADEVGLKYDYCDILSKDEFAAGVGLGEAKSGTGKHVTVLSEQPKGTPFKTIMFALGASLKGMGASGLSVEDEVARLKELISYAKENKIKIVVVAIGGEIRRGLPGSPNEVMIDTVTPYADLIIVTQDTNKDGRFTTIAEEKNIPILEIESAFDLLDTFAQLFSL